MGIKSLIQQRIRERVKNWREGIWLHLVIMFYRQVNPKNRFYFWIPCFTMKQTQSHTWKCVWIHSKESNKFTTKAGRYWQLAGSASWQLWKDSHSKSHCRERNQILLRATTCWAQFPRVHSYPGNDLFCQEAELSIFSLHPPTTACWSAECPPAPHHQVDTMNPDWDWHDLPSNSHEEASPLNISL